MTAETELTYSLCLKAGDYSINSSCGQILLPIMLIELFKNN